MILHVSQPPPPPRASSAPVTFGRVSTGVGKHGRGSHARRQLGKRHGLLLGGPEANADQLADVGKPSRGVTAAREVGIYIYIY